jgi:hypothetical protein
MRHENGLFAVYRPFTAWHSGSFFQHCRSAMHLHGIDSPRSIDDAMFIDPLLAHRTNCEYVRDK